MAAAILPKSEIRQINNISIGYGQVPMVEIEGRQGWGLPGKRITFCINEAKAVATQIDLAIRASLSKGAVSLI